MIFARRDHATLNDALWAYVVTVPSPRRLQAFLLQNGYAGDDDIQADIKKALDVVVADVYDALWDAEGGVVWSPEFERELYLSLRRRHAWLSEDGFKPLLSLGRWYCWHEGLNRPERQG